MKKSIKKQFLQKNSNLIFSKKLQAGIELQLMPHKPLRHENTIMIVDIFFFLFSNFFQKENKKEKKQVVGKLFGWLSGLILGFM